MGRFKCNGSMENRNLSGKYHFHDPIELHLNQDNIKYAALAEKKSGWIVLPFCNTLCSEGLGAVPFLSVEGARVREVPYQKAEDIPKEISFDFPRICMLFKAMDELCSEGEQIIYQIEGPFTLLTSLIPMNRMFSALRKPAGIELLKKAENWICQYVAAAAIHGVKMFSYADPVASVDILGKKVFEEVYYPSYYRLVKRIQTEHPEIPIHLCGKLTQSLLDTECCSVSVLMPHGEFETYGEAFEAWIKEGKHQAVIGHFCVNLLDAKRPWLTEVKFKEEKENVR